MLRTDDVVSATPPEFAHQPTESAHERFESALAGSSDSGQGTSPQPTQQPSIRPQAGWADEVVGNRLRVLSVLLPVGFIVALEFVRFTVDGGIVFWDGYRVFFVALTVVSIAAFGLLMFRLIDRAQRQPRSARVSSARAG